MLISDVVGYIRKASNITFIVGAGASRSAGIPTAPELVKQIGTKFRHCLGGLSDADRKNYGRMMGALSPADRRRLIEPLLAGAKLNWGHVAMARIIHDTEVRRILSFNFDFLMEKATALMGEHLPVYDFGVSPSSSVTGLADKAIFHLHGQSYGLTLLNSDEETREHAEKLRPLLADSLQNHLTIIIGYSGEADATFQVMAEAFNSNNNLIWLGYEPEPKPHLKSLLDKPYALYLGRCDFDLTMIRIARGLHCWPVPLIDNPPQHSLSLLKTLPDFPIGEEQEKDVLNSTRIRLSTLATAWDAERSDIEMVAGAVISGRSGKASVPGKPLSEEARGLAAWAYVSQGNNLADEALRLSGTAQAEKLAEARKKYARALKIKPDMHQALYNWGTVLSKEAKTLAGSTRARKLAEAGEKYAQALKIKPDKHEALNNWGAALADEAKTLAGSARARKFAEAGKKYAQALKIKPDMHQALNNWGAALSKEAMTLAGTARARKFAEAGKKYAQALKIKPDMHQALYNWGATLSEEAKTLTDSARARKFAEADKMLRKAKEVSGKAVYNLACVLALTGNISGALDELEACANDGTLLDVAHLETDSDLDALRDEPRFVALLEQQRAK